MSKKENDKHYLELGIMQGKRKFNSISFIEGLAIGFMLGVILLSF